MLDNLRLSPLTRLLLVEGESGAPGGSGGGGVGIQWTAEQQAEIDRIQGRTRAEATRAAKSAAATELAEKLGCTVDEAKTRLDKLAADETAAMTEAERIKAEAVTAKQAADAAVAAAAKERFDAKVERKLLAAGVGTGLDADKAEKALTRVRRMLDIGIDSDDAAIAAAIDDAKADVPSLFTAAEVTPPPFGGTPPPAPAKPPAPGGSVSQIDPARERARARNGFKPDTAAS